MYKLKNILFCVCVLICFKASAQVQIGGDTSTISYERPKEYVIGGVLISGTKYLDENVLVNLSGLIVGDTIDVPGEKTSKAIQNLWKQGLFSDVKLAVDHIQGNYIFFLFQLQEKPRLSKFNFKGVSKGEAEKIREKIKLERDKVITESVIASTKNTVRSFYVEKGFMNATVSIKEEKDTTLVNHNNLEIDVVRGHKVKIRKIDIQGNEALSDGKIRKAMKNTKQKVWWKLFTSSKYIEDNFEEDKGKIIAKYNEKGYRDAKITGSNVEKLKQSNIVFIKSWKLLVNCINQ